MKRAKQGIQRAWMYGINIPGNKQGVLDAGQKTKFTKSTTSRMQQDCSKGMAVGGPIQDDKGLEKRLTYVYSVKVPVNNLKKGRPFIKYARSIHLDDIQKEEIKQNKLRMGEFEKRCSENFDASNDDTDLQEIQNMFGEVEVKKLNKLQ
ncbi:hypothetical protein L2E82_25052 [Cichorium intybus]|uniref:Uncharacterized protein n=1 Tax=Cichorium intybus TaxID=13427 RepID=A0ACB9E1Z8_CICIN|nr:hypothetical protein L2E82_25052 [Cichorium intybus]